MNEIAQFPKKHPGESFPKKQHSDRPDETPKSFAPEHWRDAIARGGYWSATLGYFVPVRLTDEEEELIERVMAQHPKLTREEAVEMLMLKR